MPASKGRSGPRRGRASAGEASSAALEPRRGFGGGSTVPQPIGGRGGGKNRQQPKTRQGMHQETEERGKQTTTCVDDLDRDDSSSETDSSRQTGGGSSMNVVQDEVTEGSSTSGRKRSLEDYDDMANRNGSSAVKAYRKSLMASGSGAVWSMNDTINVTIAKTKEEVFPIIKFFDASGNKDARTEKHINDFIHTRIPRMHCDDAYKKIRTEIARTLRVRRSSVVHAAGIRIRGWLLSKCGLGLDGFTILFVLIFFLAILKEKTIDHEEPSEDEPWELKEKMSAEELRDEQLLAAEENRDPVNFKVMIKKVTRKKSVGFGIDDEDFNMLQVQNFGVRDKAKTRKNEK
jgi:hypothetical protein